MPNETTQPKLAIFDKVAWKTARGGRTTGYVNEFINDEECYVTTYPIKQRNKGVYADPKYKKKIADLEIVKRHSEQ